MGLTPISASTSYCAPQQLAQFHDWRPLARLCQDSDSAAQETLTAFLTDPVALAHLQAASGELEAAILLGERYQVPDLVALAGTNAGTWLAQIVAGLAAGTIYERRSGSRVTEQEARKIERAREALESLKRGERILGFQESAAAGLVSSQDALEADLQSRRGMVTIARPYWGQRGRDMNG